MLIVYLFNLTGYPLLFNFLMDKANEALLVRLDENRYDESFLREIKIPFYIPYVTGTDHYERYDGQVEVDGVKYTYVKRKFSGDTLYLLYLPDSHGTKLLTAKNEYGQKVSDFPSEKKEKDTPVKKGGPSVQYKSQETFYSFAVCPVITKQQGFYITAALPLPNVTQQEQPPDYPLCFPI